ncbi:MAG TPA: hypothetical protein PK760_03645 [Flavobacteriales bacterium]|nr:hypothetical protein [Flavobacteriales bacterium]
MSNRASLLIALLLMVHAATAQTTTSADDFFNLAAKQYVKEDKLAALKTLDKGLQEHPGDARMLKLAEELLKEQQQKQQQEQQKKDQEQKEQEQQKKEQEKQDQAQQEKEKEQQQGQGKGGEKKEGERKPGQISQQDAARILDALEHQEKNTQEKVRARVRPMQRRRIDKDW